MSVSVVSNISATFALKFQAPDRLLSSAASAFKLVNSLKAPPLQMRHCATSPATRRAQILAAISRKRIYRAVVCDRKIFRNEISMETNFLMRREIVCKWRVPPAASIVPANPHFSFFPFFSFSREYSSVIT